MHKLVTIERVFGVNQDFAWIWKENICFYQGDDRKLFRFELWFNVDEKWSDNCECNNYNLRKKH